MSLVSYPDYDPKLGPRHCQIAPDPDIFFAEADIPRTRESYEITARAKAVCEVCPYKQRCQDWALAHPEERGVWGGLSEDDRRQMRRKIKVSVYS